MDSAITAQSFRSDGATSGIKNGVQADQLMVTGRWKSTNIFYGHYVAARPNEDTTDRILGIKKNKIEEKQSLLTEVCVTREGELNMQGTNKKNPLWEEKISLQYIFGNSGNAQEQLERDEEVRNAFKEAKLVDRKKAKVIKNSLLINDQADSLDEEEDSSTIQAKKKHKY